MRPLSRCCFWSQVLRFSFALSARSAVRGRFGRATPRFAAAAEADADEALDSARFDGCTRLYGASSRGALQGSSVAVVGLGGVGSWAVEALARTGVGRLVLVDLDEVCVSNSNRQIGALASTVGRTKAAVLAQRASDINPALVVDVILDFADADNCAKLLGLGTLLQPTVVVDAVDSVEDKVAILRACQLYGVPLVVVGAAGGRRNAAKVRGLRGVQDAYSGRKKAGAKAFPISQGGDRMLKQVRKLIRSTQNEAHAVHEGFDMAIIYSDEAPQQAPLGALKKGGCDQGLGTCVMVTGAFGLVAAQEAVDFVLQLVDFEAEEADDESDEADEADDGGFDEADCPCADFSSGPWAAAGAPAKRPAGRGGHTGLFGGPRARRRATRLFSTATRQGPRHTLVDTHSHVPPFRAGSAGSVLVSCHAAHWDGLASRALEGGNVALGVHPWWAGSVEDGWEASLREKLEAAPGALVGECGLDGLRGGGRGAVDAAQDVVFDGARQEAIFSAHVEIATSLKRPMTLHCVRAYGRIRECLAGRSTLPPAVALHAYGGSFEYARDFSTMLAKNGCATYFGVSAPRGNAEVPAKAATKRAALIAQLGDDSILLESDSHDSQAVDDLLDRAARTVAEAKGWTAAETARRCNANAIAFVGSGALRR